VRTTEVHGGEAQGAVPSTHPRAADTKVTDAGVNPRGTGPPAGPATATDVGAPVEAEGEVVVDEEIVEERELAVWLQPAATTTSAAIQTVPVRSGR
jgi:hypothetical protein